MATKIICNKCGKKFDRWDKVEAFSIYSFLGYGTKHDGDKLELDLCCSCMDELIESCKISPVVEIHDEYFAMNCNDSTKRGDAKI